VAFDDEQPAARIDIDADGLDDIRRGGEEIDAQTRVGGAGPIGPGFVLTMSRPKKEGRDHKAESEQQEGSLHYVYRSGVRRRGKGPIVPQRGTTATIIADRRIALASGLTMLAELRSGRHIPSNAYRRSSRSDR
jgi:hypothetical protein